MAGEVPAVVSEPATSTLEIPLTDADRDALDEMAGKLGVTAVNLVRVALWQYSHHLGLVLPLETFGVRRSRISSSRSPG